MNIKDPSAKEAAEVIARKLLGIDLGDAEALYGADVDSAALDTQTLVADSGDDRGVLYFGLAHGGAIFRITIERAVEQAALAIREQFRERYDQDGADWEGVSLEEFRAGVAAGIEFEAHCPLPEAPKRW